MRVLVTGGTGFLGHHLVPRLRAKGHDVRAPSSKEIDLREPADAKRGLEGVDGVYHLAGVVGGIQYNVAHPASLLFDNTVMGLHILEAARKRDVAWVVLVGSACAYPGEAAVPTREEALWTGYPEESNAPYGVAKRVVSEAASAYARQYGLRVHSVVPTNMYGPHDHFDPEVAHVLPSLMTRFHRAKLANAPEVVCWGDGSPTRDLLYVDDCAGLLVDAPDVMKGPEPVNLGTGNEVSIREIAETVRDVVGFQGRISWDTSKPLGQRRRALSTERMERIFGRRPFMPFREGVRRTYEHFLTTSWARVDA